VNLPVPKRLRILVVDDEPVVAQVILAALLLSGHVVATASSGVEALELFRGGDWDLVITDRKMPGKDGDELAVEIKVLNPMMPVIMTTGSMEPSLGKQSDSSHVDCLIRKPFRLEALTAAIAALIPGVGINREQIFPPLN
jgi:CheY-like chemotaxis protein